MAHYMCTINSQNRCAINKLFSSSAIKSLDEKSSRIENIEEVIETLGTTFSSIKTKKDENLARNEPKFVYVPKVPRAKADTPIAKRVETVKALEETTIFNSNETPMIFLLSILSLEAFLFGLSLRNLLRLVVLLKSFLMILMMVQLIQLDLLL